MNQKCNGTQRSPDILPQLKERLARVEVIYITFVRDLDDISFICLDMQTDNKTHIPKMEMIYLGA